MEVLNNTNIYISVLLTFFSAFLFFRQKTRWAVGVLFIAALALRYYYISLDAFLHDWDEHFHALVAKNMMTHPFQPMLRVNPVLPYDYKAWCCNHIWLHKQPLFLWQMALSMKIFGVNEIALRLPNMLMTALLIPLVYRIGRLWANAQTGFIAAILTLFARYQLELVSGNASVDHNDIAFSFYVMMSVWSYAEYTICTHKKWRWLVLIGVFVGGAVLCKWLTGLVVFSGWGLTVVFDKEKRSVLQNWYDMVSAFVVSCAVFLPWQIYNHLKFPKESTFERIYNTRHLTEAIEGHGGSLHFYLAHNDMYFGLPGCIFAGIGMGCLLFFREKISYSWLAWLAFIIVPYLIFSLAATKMSSFVYFIAPLVHLCIGLGIVKMIEYCGTKMTYFENNKNIGRLSKWFAPVAIVCLSAICTWQIYDQPIPWLNRNDPGIQAEFAQKRKNTAIFKALNHKIGKDVVIFNCTGNADIDMMFYTENTVYAWSINANQYNYLKAKNIKMAIFADHKQYIAPDYLKKDKGVYTIPEILE
jgi:4-amino-4-deoxy-L-arabinose transferase-like glycosyltransferase